MPLPRFAAPHGTLGFIITEDGSKLNRNCKEHTHICLQVGAWPLSPPARIAVILTSLVYGLSSISFRSVLN